MPSITKYAYITAAPTSQTGFLRSGGSTGTTWALLRAGVSLAAWNATNPISQVRTSSASTWYWLDRGYVTWYVTGLTGTNTATTVRLYLQSADVNFTGYNAYCNIYAAVPGTPPGYTAGEWTSVLGAALCDTPVLITGASAGWVEFVLNAAGLALVQNGYITISVLLTLDKDNTPPAWEYVKLAFVQFAAAQLAPNTQVPQLVITYTTISVRTDPATNVSSGNATLNGTLLEDGGDTPVTCYFDYGLTSACELGNIPVGGIVVTEGNSYLLVLTGLSPNTTYYFKAKAVGTSGATVYGSVLSFGSASYPSRPLTRVTAIHTVFRAGRGGQPGEYYQELLLGGLATEWIPALRSYQPTVGEGKKPGEMGINYKPVTFPPDMNALAKNMNMFFPQNQYRQYVKWRMAGGGDVSYTDWLKGAR